MLLARTAGGPRCVHARCRPKRAMAFEGESDTPRLATPVAVAALLPLETRFVFERLWRDRR